MTYNSNGAVFQVASETQAPTISTGKYIFFGRIDVVIQAAPGAGIVTSAVLQSDDLDEIDWEWVGADNAQVQSNYFSKGDTSTYDRGAYHPVGNPTGSFHTYSVDWTAERIEWLIDGNVVRTLTAASAKGGSAYPQTPMQVKLGAWCAGGSKSAPGTVEWAGGRTDFSKGPFNAYYKKITIVDYAGKSSPATGGVKEYSYGDNSGSWQSIKIDGGNSSNDEENASTSSAASSSTAKSTSTKASSTTKTTQSSKTTETKTTMTTAASSTGSSASTGAAETTAAASTSAGGASTTAATGAGPTASIAAAGALLAGAGFVAQILL